MPDSAEPENEPTAPRLRIDRRRFLKAAGAFAAGVVGLLTFGLLARRAGTPQGPVASGTAGPEQLLSSFPVRSAERTPRTSLEDWVVTVDGLVEKPLRLDREAWSRLARRDEVVDFHCVEGWSVDAVSWGGVPLATVLDATQPRPEAVAATFHAAGGVYTDDLTLAEARDPQVLLADTIGGEPLPAEHGGPVRLVVPSQLGYKSVKWVERIELVSERTPGYWEQNGYPAEAPVPESVRRQTE
jgi:DMSO/TMAO reductase YedYZ molybdopterin-dependent catalytic subunit